MATGNMVVTVVDVGQGQCTFVEIYDNSSPVKLVQTLLFDCGSDSHSDELDFNLQYIANKVCGMASPAFDAVFFSHSDSDHISLMIRLLKKCSIKPTIKLVRYGGNPDQYDKDGTNILDYLVDNGYCLKKDIKGSKTNFTNYNAKTKKFGNHLWKSPDGKVIVYALSINVMSAKASWTNNSSVPKGKTPVARNRVSLVALLVYAGRSYIICGDAVNATMAAIGALFSAGTTAFDYNAMTTIPHHGSRTTGLSVPSSRTASTRAVRVVENFAELLKSKTISVSAYAKHNHPSLELMNLFIPTLTNPILRDPRLEERNSHYITANMDIDLVLGLPAVGKKRPKSFVIPTGVDTSLESRDNTFSTRYFDSAQTRYSYQLGNDDAGTSKGLTHTAGAINGFACWQYITTSAGSTSVIGFSNLAAVTGFTSSSLTSSAAGTEALLDEWEETGTGFRAGGRSNCFERKTKTFSLNGYGNRIYHRYCSRCRAGAMYLRRDL
jgi:hypothetical protein